MMIHDPGAVERTIDGSVSVHETAVTHFAIVEEALRVAQSLAWKGRDVPAARSMVAYATDVLNLAVETLQKLDARGQREADTGGISPQIVRGMREMFGQRVYDLRAQLRGSNVWLERGA
jgi:hypothetical protein